MKIKTRTNALLEEPLTHTVSLKMTYDEYEKLKVVSNQYSISISELSRNLIRDNLGNYAMSPNLAKFLHISNEIDKFLLEKRLILNRKASNLSKIREILTDFEENLELPLKKIDIDSTKIDGFRVVGLLKVIYETDQFLSDKIDEQVKRIYKNKTFKGLELNLGE